VDVHQGDRDYAETENIKIWTLQELDYYQALVDTIGEVAKYEMLAYFNLPTNIKIPFHPVLAIKFKQPHSTSSIELFSFTITPHELLQSCVVYRKAQGNADAYQRMLKKDRLKNIREFVSGSNALLPTNIVVHLSEEIDWNPIVMPSKSSEGKPISLTDSLSCEMGVLTIPLKYASMEIIDGQHRLFGFSEADAATKEKFNLVVLGIKGLEGELRRDTFVAINDKSRRMDANLVAYLKYTPDESLCQKNNELMAIRLAVELNTRYNSPLRNKIRLVDKGKEKITLKGISGYDLKGLISSNMLLRKYYPNNTDELYEVLRLYSNLIKSTFSDEWKDPEKYIIATNRGVSAFLKLLKSIIRVLDCKLDAKNVSPIIKALKKNWKKGWEIEKLANAYIGSKGWKDFHRDMVKAIKKEVKKFE
jgi:DNA sulfur modification protein DndB